MKDLVMFYLLTSATYTLPMLFVTVILLKGTPLPTLSNLRSYESPVERVIRKIGLARLGHDFLLLDANVIDYIKQFYVLASCLQLISMALIILAITYEVPFPFVSNIYGVLSLDVMFKLLKFGLISSAILSIPFFIFALALYFDFPLVSKTPGCVIRTPNSVEIGRWAKRSQKFAMVHLSRFENFEKIIIFVTVKGGQLGETRKIALCQGKEKGARTECYMYNEDEPNVRKIIPVPITVNDVEEMFNVGY